MSNIEITKNGDFFVIKGKGTFKERENIKKFGGFWVKDMKAWMVSQQREADLRNWQMTMVEAERENDLKQWQKESKEEQSTPSDNETLLKVLKIVKELRKEVKELRKEVKELKKEEESSDSDSD